MGIRRCVRELDGRARPGRVASQSEARLVRGWLPHPRVRCRPSWPWRVFALVALFGFLVGVGASVGWAAAPGAVTGQPVVYEVLIAGPVDASVALLMERGASDAEDAHAAA